MSSEKKPVLLAAKAEEDQVSRNMVIWANTFPDLPEGLAGLLPVDYEHLIPGKPCMALSTIQSAYIIKRYILGGYQAQYQFKIVYRVQPGRSLDSRLKADELLNRFGDWAESQRPEIGGNMRVLRIEATTRSSLFANYENGDEDHQILLNMTYEVNDTTDPWYILK